MPRLIDADEAYKVLTDYYNHRTEIQHEALKEAIGRVPTVDAEPVRYGRWQVNEVDGYKDMTCLSCGWLFEYYDGLEEEWNYCPHCGALQSFAIATEKEIEMPRYIDADKIADFVCSVCGDICDDEFKNRGCIERQFTEECVKKMPTVDAVEVVRCKDCESWGLNAIKKDEKGEVIYGDCLHFCYSTPKWFYCAWGERKNGQ